MKKFICTLKQRIRFNIRSKAIPKDRLFYWTGMSPLGEVTSGYIAAHNRTAAKQILRKQTVIIRQISTQHRWQRRIRPHDITLLLQQLSRILHTGISLMPGLHIMRSCQTRPVLQLLIHHLQKDLSSGASFTEALARHPQYFDSLLCALIQLGERSGSLNLIIEQIVLYRTKQYHLKQQFKSILIYPTTVIVIATVVTLYLLLTVVPQLHTFYQHAQRPLPWSTQMLLQGAAYLKKQGYVIMILGVLSSLYLKKQYQHAPSIRRWIDQKIVQAPGLGDVCQSIYLARACYTLAIAQKASLPLIDGLQWAALTMGNDYYKQGFLNLKRAVLEGENLRSALLQSKVFPELFVQMMGLGEESGTLSVLLNDLAQYYTNRVADTLENLSRCVEPALMLILGLIIGGLMLCIYLPMIQLGAVL